MDKQKWTVDDVQKLEDDPRIGRAVVNLHGEVGTIEAIHRLPDGYEVWSVQLSDSLSYSSNSDAFQLVGP